MPKNMKDQLTEGSHYKVRSFTAKEEVLTSRGYFEGYIQIGNHHAIKIELDESHDEEGTIRIIPYHTIANIDILEQVEPSKDENDDKNTYFG